MDRGGRQSPSFQVQCQAGCPRCTTKKKWVNSHYREAFRTEWFFDRHPLCYTPLLLTRTLGVQFGSAVLIWPLGRKFAALCSWAKILRGGPKQGSLILNRQLPYDSRRDRANNLHLDAIAGLGDRARQCPKKSMWDLPSQTRVSILLRRYRRYTAPITLNNIMNKTIGKQPCEEMQKSWKYGLLAQRYSLLHYLFGLPFGSAP